MEICVSQNKKKKIKEILKYAIFVYIVRKKKDIKYSVVENCVLNETPSKSLLCVLLHPATLNLKTQTLL